MWIKYGHDKMHENHKNLDFCRFESFESTIGVSSKLTGQRKAQPKLEDGQRKTACVDHRVGA
jgi:hypothetical protein